MELPLRNWNCRSCGRTNNTIIEPDGTVTCEFCGDVKSIQPSRNRGGETARPPANAMKSMRGVSGLDPREDSEKRESFALLREQYIEARKLVSSDEPYANLEWILGARGNGAQDPPALETKTIELAALWLQDLAVEVDRRPPRRPAGDSDGRAPLAPRAGRAGETPGQSLRDATARFLIAFKSSVGA
jgi:hypothetical protein